MTNFDRVVGLMGASVVAIACASPAMAQTRTYSIPAQSAASGVAALARQSDQQVLISARDAKGKKTGEVRGEMTIEQAFAKLLAGSGLTAKRTGAGAWAVVQGGNGEAASPRADAPATIAQTSVSANASTIVDARTGATLKGALVEIVETGEKTSTGDLGEFRFPGKNGSFNLRISYLGYPEYQQFVDLKEGRATTGIVLSDGSAINDIVVTAYQSARAQALNQERTAENVSTVVSSDLLGQFDGNTISEALRRSTGVAFSRDPITGDGVNISVRGLGSQFNTVSMNGLRLPVGNATSRSPSLNNILADSVSKITLNKTLLPSQDGSGTGALIEIETKGPLDRPKRFFSVTAEAAKSAHSFLNEASFSGTGSIRLGGSDNFGISASVQYRDRDIRNVTANNPTLLTEYLPLTDGGRIVQSESDIDPRRVFPFEPTATNRYPTGSSILEYQSNVKNISAGISAQWQIGTHTNLRLDYNYFKTKTNSGNTFNTISQAASMELVPIDELNGESRISTIWETADGQRTIYATYGAGINENVENTSVLGFKGDTTAGKWEFNYRAGYTKGSTRRTSFIIGSSTLFLDIPENLLLPDIAANTNSGRTVSLFAPGNRNNVVFPGLTQEGYDFLNEDQGGNFSFASASDRVAQNARYTGAIDGKLSISNSILNYIQAGVFFERSTSHSDNLYSDSYSLFPGPLLSSVGLTPQSPSFSDRAVPVRLNMISLGQVRSFEKQLLAGAYPQINKYSSDFDQLQKNDSLREDDLSGYIQASANIGNLNIVGGLRMERVKTIANVISESNIFDEAFQIDPVFQIENRQIARLTASQVSFLPRMTANWKLSDNLIFRAGYYKSYARPSLSLLSQQRIISYYQSPFLSPNRDRPTLFISAGNPGLKASETDNIDLSLEWYDKDIGAVKIGAFYKPTKKPFFSIARPMPEDFDPSSLPTDPRLQSITAANTYISYSMPINGTKTAKLWGMEASIEKKLTFLPGLFSGLGVFANVVITDSSRQVTVPFPPEGDVLIDNVPYDGQIPLSGTTAVTYSRSGLDASLSYTWQKRGLTSFGYYGYSAYTESIDSLDFKVQYQTSILGNSLKIYLEGSDLLKGVRDQGFGTSEGSGQTRSTLDQIYYGGRSIRIGASYSF